MFRIATIAFFVLLVLPADAQAGCTERCGDLFSSCLINGGSRNYCWRLGNRCIEVCPYLCFRKKNRDGSWGPVACSRKRG